jgi:hypothetical protein
MFYSNNKDKDTSDRQIPVKRLQFNFASGVLEVAPKKELFLRGPIPMDWLTKATVLPGKTLNVAIALWWLHGMSKGKPFKLTQAALDYMNVERDAASNGLRRLERTGLIKVERRPGQRPMIAIVIGGVEPGAE